MIWKYFLSTSCQFPYIFTTCDDPRQILARDRNEELLVNSISSTTPIFSLINTDPIHQVGRTSMFSKVRITPPAFSFENQLDNQVNTTVSNGTSLSALLPPASRTTSNTIFNPYNFFWKILFVHKLFQNSYSLKKTTRLPRCNPRTNLTRQNFPSPSYCYSYYLRRFSRKQDIIVFKIFSCLCVGNGPQISMDTNLK